MSPSLTVPRPGWSRGIGFRIALAAIAQLKQQAKNSNTYVASASGGSTVGTTVYPQVFGDPDVVPMWFGESDLVTPDFVRDAAAAGLRAPSIDSSTT